MISGEFLEVKSLFLKALRKIYSDQSLTRSAQFATLGDLMFRLSVDEGKCTQSEAGQFQNTVNCVISEVFWQAIASGIIGIGIEQNNDPRYPFFHITAYGKELIQNDDLAIYDPLEIIKNLKSKIPSLDPLVIDYLQESSICFERHCLKATTVMLGVASEFILERVINSFENYFSDSSKLQKYQTSIESTTGIKKKFDAFRSYFELVKPEIKKNTGKDSLDISLSGIFDIIRRSRNETGHPTGILVTQREVLSLLLIFERYCIDSYFLCDYFSNTKSAVL